jgi:hypothetical protein
MDLDQASLVDTSCIHVTSQPKRKYVSGRPIIPVQPSRCPVCGSIKRTLYFRKTKHPLNASDPRIRYGTHIVWRFCDCRQCGEPRIDESIETLPSAD